MKKNKLFWILTVVCVLNFAAHLYFYPSLPDIVPTHWGANGQVNGWGPKSTILILAALPFAMLIMFEVIRKVDPKHQNFEKFGKVWNLFVVLFTVMMAMFSWLSELAVFGKLPDNSSLIGILVCGGIGVLFIILGNFMPQIKQNYTFGCRTPWALNDEHNWQRTQRMGGYTFVIMGISLLVIAFLGGLLGDAGCMILLLVAVFGGSAWIYLYSYLVYIGKMKYPPKPSPMGEGGPAGPNEGEACCGSPQMGRTGKCVPHQSAVGAADSFPHGGKPYKQPARASFLKRGLFLIYKALLV